MEIMHQPLIMNARQPYLTAISVFPGFMQHWHDETEILFMLSGSMYVMMDGQRHHVKTGDIVLIAKNTLHATQSEMERKQAYHLLVECGSALLGDDYALINGKTFLSPILHCGTGNAAADRLGRLLWQIVEEMAADVCGCWWKLHDLLFPEAPIGDTGLPDPGWVADYPEPIQPKPAYASALRGLICTAFAVIIREIPMVKTPVTQLNDQRLRWFAIFDYIAVHYMEPIPIEKAAQQAGYSVYHFSRAFREHTGIPFHQYLNRYRVERAIMLLAEPSMSVTQVSGQSGFESIKTFNRVFRQETGMSPTTYRKRLLGKLGNLE